MLIKVDAMFSNEYYKFGIQTNKDNIDNRMHENCLHFKPSKAKSYTIFDYVNTDYHGIPTGEVITGYADFKVKYFTRITEGEFKFKDNIK
jgi:hypothetical protein